MIRPRTYIRSSDAGKAHLGFAACSKLPAVLPDARRAGLSHLDFAELGEKAGEEGVVPCGAHTLSFHGLLRAFESGKVESKAAQQGDVLRPVIAAVSGLVFVHGHVEDPMQTVLHPQWARATAPKRSALSGVLSR